MDATFAAMHTLHFVDNISFVVRFGVLRHWNESSHSFSRFAGNYDAFYNDLRDIFSEKMH